MHQLMLSFCKGSEPINREFIELGIYNREPEIEEDDFISIDPSFEGSSVFLHKQLFWISLFW